MENAAYKEVYDRGVQTLQSAGVADAGLDARLLLEFVCHTDRNTLYAHADMPVSDYARELYEQLIRRRAQRIPLQHLLGTQEFMGLSFVVNEHVLIPRQDTECLVEEAMICTMDGDRVLDLCTGSGCILLSIMCYKNEIEGVGTDISNEALQIARLNAERLEKPALFVNCDLFGQLPEEPFDIIVSNPPYIRSDVIETLAPEVKDHEPRGALDGGSDGLVFYKRILKDAPRYIRRGGTVLLEIGYDQGEAVSSMMKEAGFDNVETVKDLAGNDRVVKGIWVK